MLKTLKTILQIPYCHVLGIGDTGTSIEVDKKNKITECDDLRLTIELSGGHFFILQNSQHIGYERDEKGYLWLHIYEYVPIKP